MKIISFCSHCAPGGAAPREPYRERIGAMPPSERNRVVLLPVRCHLLVPERGKRAGDAAARGMRHDHLVDEAAFGGHERRSEEHTSELQSLMRISYAVFCLKKKNTTKPRIHTR